jgi:uncharacterized membrane protein YphA (DoxX/SURF4 family)
LATKKIYSSGGVVYSDPGVDVFTCLPLLVGLVVVWGAVAAAVTAMLAALILHHHYTLSSTYDMYTVALMIYHQSLDYYSCLTYVNMYIHLPKHTH